MKFANIACVVLHKIVEAKNACKNQNKYRSTST